ncbi:MAG: CBS domain-containing protein [Phycisphaerales bacterium]|nr:CBS domain-containing protein [Phycisphaerales bacterium]
MFTVSQLLAHKQEAGTRTVATVTPGTTVLDAARLMNDQHIGSLVVTDADGGVAGIITERDFLRRVIAAEKTPAETPVRDVMTRDVLTCSPHTKLDEIRGVMREKRIRHLPVIDERGLHGMISIGDLNFAESQNLSEQVNHLESYIRSA